MPPLENPHSTIKVSVLGVRGQAARHLNTISASPQLALQHVYHPNLTRVEKHLKEELPLTDDLNKIQEADAIIIASPTPVHFSQLEALYDYPGYILLEKPVATKKEHIDQLLNISDERKSRIKVNFNFQHNPVALEFENILLSNLIGRLIHATFETNHGGAFRDGWDKNWRSSDRLSGPIFTVGIHYLQWLITQLGNPDGTTLNTSNFSVSNHDDSGTAHLHWNNGVSASILTSYASAFKVNFQLTGTDGYVTYDGSNVMLYAPRDTFDNDGYFTSPPATHQLHAQWSHAYSISLENSISSFAQHCKYDKNFDPYEFDRDVLSIIHLIN